MRSTCMSRYWPCDFAVWLPSHLLVAFLAWQERQVHLDKEVPLLVDKINQDLYEGENLYGRVLTRQHESDSLRHQQIKASEDCSKVLLLLR